MQLSPDMRKALRKLLQDGGQSVARGTLNALVRRDLANEDGSLTREGWIWAMTMVPLKEQCRRLGIRLQTIEGLDFKGRPEKAAWEHFTRQGYTGGYCEGGPILLLIRAAALPTLARLNTFKSRGDACTRATEAQLTILEDKGDEILGEVSKVTPKRVRARFREIYSRAFVRETYPGLTADAVSNLFATLGNDTLVAITRALMEDPYQYRSGWPDLTMTNGDNLIWYEVKTTDKLHGSQIATLRRMLPLLPGDVGVIRLTNG